jgi:hypothetical protein
VRSDAAVPVLKSLHTSTTEEGLENLLLPGIPLKRAEDTLFHPLIEEVAHMGPVPIELVGHFFTRNQLGDWNDIEPVSWCELDQGLLQMGHECYREGDPEGAKQGYGFRLREDDTGPIVLANHEGSWYSEKRVLPESRYARPIPPSIESSGPMLSTILAYVPSSDPRARLTAPEGTPVFWMDGSPAGKTERDWTLYALQLQERESGRLCTGLPWAKPEDRLSSSDCLGLLAEPCEPQPEEGAPKPIEDYPIQVCFEENDLTPGEEPGGLNESSEDSSGLGGLSE